MDVYLMRHPARENVEGWCIGQTDVALSAEGIASLPGLGQAAARVKPTRLVSSDLKRCRILAETIAGACNLTVEINPAWRELHLGAWENRTWDDLRREDPARLEAWLANFVEIAPPGGESFRHLQERALGALDQLERAPHETVVVTTHAGVIRSLTSAFSDIPLERNFEISVPYGSLTHLSWREGKWTLGAKPARIVHSLQKEAK